MANFVAATVQAVAANYSTMAWNDVEVSLALLLYLGDSPGASGVSEEKEERERFCKRVFECFPYAAVFARCEFEAS